MKKLAIIFLLIATAGCKDFLEEDPKGQVVGTNAISDIAGLESALTGSYKGLLRTWARGFLTSAIQGYGMGADDISTISGGNKADFREIDQLNVTSANPRLFQIWSGCYKTIQGANNIINNYQNVAGDPARINAIVGEAHFLRALGYYWLVRGYGNIPLITTADFSEDLLTIQKSAPAEVYKLIEADLQKAETLLPDKKRDPGRPNKGSAKAMLADVYLTEGGWPMKDVSKYPLAAAKAKEVIDNKDLYGFDLVPDLATLWSGSASATGTKEEVFAFQTSENFGGSTNSFYGLPAVPGDENGWDDYLAEITFFNNFPAGKRKDVTFHTVFTKPDGKKVPWQQSLAKHPYYAKFRLADNTKFTSSMPVHMIRYAHLLLVYAEAQARTDAAPNAQAYAAVNAVRKRAGLADLSGLSKTAFIDAIVDERAWEFAGEWNRWFDLLRLEKVAEANANKAADDLKPIGDISKSNYWYPAPIGDANINPNL
ncbi:RagB/SusD family nutrient uptake outer membrane protein [Dyadobacter sp. CY261]|uniref:RagB/SusD family nutrient uptake outer membrane protein n=1 Tax=Dyadobacter sp. CY261 TaxID=2907203 RepID=UPI001F3C3541|nr:RagB/SusD family nutrient uptake outer membrane protein [Dyadobacter sp. CY261]MCF0069104.1 RagB/SusD family nutrient uptake outer membrane protein [Dyadobacter sp. CY261]